MWGSLEVTPVIPQFLKSGEYDSQEEAEESELVSRGGASFLCLTVQMKGCSQKV